MKPNEMTYATAMHVLSQVCFGVGGLVVSLLYMDISVLYICYTHIHTPKALPSSPELNKTYRPVIPIYSPRLNSTTNTTAAHTQAGQYREALRLLGRMEAKGIRNIVALTSAMTACEAGKAYEEGLALWDRMQVRCVRLSDA